MVAFAQLGLGAKRALCVGKRGRRRRLLFSLLLLLRSLWFSCMVAIDVAVLFFAVATIVAETTRAAVSAAAPAAGGMVVAIAFVVNVNLIIRVGGEFGASQIRLALGRLYGRLALWTGGGRRVVRGDFVLHAKERFAKRLSQPRVT